MRFKYQKPNEPFVVRAWYPVVTEDTKELVWLETVWKVKRRWNSGWEYYSCKQNIESERGGGRRI